MPNTDKLGPRFRKGKENMIWNMESKKPVIKYIKCQGKRQVAVKYGRVLDITRSETKSISSIKF